MANGVVFTMEREETGNIEEYPEIEYFEGNLDLL